jgi:hypothetical protein
VAKKQGLSPAAVGAIVVLGSIVAVFSWLKDNVGSLGMVVGCAVLVGGVCCFIVHRRNQRLTYLRSKYSDENIVQLIMRRRFWDGQSEEQLMDSIGKPSRVDKQVLMTKRREVWKYHQTGKNRYRLRITLDHGRVVDWDEKGAS